ncbi:ribosomal protein S4, bacterial/organelle type [Halobacteroides halobius DSM 5150]|uniref:Small ribosomal subunit protein uS4 n=1 Tax=Halobacteroides halobius (strain ATCC 35273 / DSM 5150 / MD-1) TaxID=748449 RepID=L0K4M8_HALHC|nr:30S ribosomal protein S4 [Halobacteroides halobius]AGB40227.1 ribosomal protein S4, bacterial/organelle type [Halobacteroides halobius DSM 5150]
MARYTGPVCKLCRREGEKLFLKGERCHSDKCAIERRPYAPGEHGQGRRGKLSEYGVQLREKQKVRRAYGVLENQFRRYFEEAEHEPGITGENFLQLLERRLDNVVYRLGFATSRNEARQFVRHGHILVNGSRLDIPSYRVKTDDKIEVAEDSKSMKRMKEIAEYNEEKELPSWLQVDFNKLEGTVLTEPVRDEIDLPIQEQLIVEFYSR